MNSNSNISLFDLYIDELEKIDEVLFAEIQAITGYYELTSPIELNDNGQEALAAIVCEIQAREGLYINDKTAKTIHPKLTADLLEQAIDKTYYRLYGKA